MSASLEGAWTLKRMPVSNWVESKLFVASVSGQAAHPVQTTLS